MNNTLNEIRAIDLDIHIWSARRKLRVEDLKNLSQDSIPPATLASLGSKIICDPDEIAVFTRLKKQATRACEAVGTRFLHGYAVPKGEIVSLTETLNKIKKEFETKKASFIARYDQIISSWMAENEQWRNIIAKAITPADVVAARTSFGFQVFAVNEATADDDSLDDSLNTGLNNHVDSLADTLLTEISKEALKLWENSFHGRDSITRRVLSPLNMLRAKLNGFVFIDPCVAPIVGHIDNTLAGLPKKGRIEGKDLLALEGLCLLISNKDKLKAHGNAIIANNNRPVSDQAETEEPVFQVDLSETVVDEEAESVPILIDTAVDQDEIRPVLQPEPESAQPKYPSWGF